MPRCITTPMVTSEDEFEAMFAAAGKKNIKRGKFGRYARQGVHCLDGSEPRKS
jgi:hypothetical protein